MLSVIPTTVILGALPPLSAALGFKPRALYIVGKHATNDLQPWALIHSLKKIKEVIAQT